MKNKSKIFIFFIVAIFVFLFILIFLKVFNFEGKKDEITVSEDVVNETHNMLLTNKYEAKYGFYNGYFTKYSSLDYETILTLGYYYLQEHNLISSNSLSNNELIEVVPNVSDAKALAKVPLETYNSAIYNLFGNDVKINYVNFNTNNLYGYYAKEKENIYIYEKDNNANEQYYIYNDITSYELNRNKDLIIYDYYIKCDKNTKICYNDEKLTMKNNKVSYEINILSNKDNIVKYKHTFKINDEGNYYWYSSDLYAK